MTTNNNAIISRHPRLGFWEAAIVTPEHRVVSTDRFRSLRAAVDEAQIEGCSEVYVRHHWTVRGPKWANTWHRVA